MEYYIQGDAANADKIKAAFEKLGYDTITNGWNFNANCGVYFTDEVDKLVDYTHIKTFVNLIKTHPDYKELELPATPKFKVGDEIVWNEPKGNKPTEPVKIIQLIDKDQLYMVDMANGIGYVSYDMQDYYKLVQKPHYDIANFHAGMPVLVRDCDEHKWLYTLFGIYIKDNSFYPFVVVNLLGYAQCIPFEGNEALLGTTDMPSEEYINW